MTAAWIGLLAFFVSIEAKTHTIVVPQHIVPGLPLPLSFTFLSPNVSDVHVQIDLVKNEHERVTSVEHVFKQGLPGVVSVPVPEHLEYQYNYKLIIHGLAGVYFIEESTLTYDTGVIEDKFAIFIQTDKAIYKPGQTVRFRAFGMWSNMTVFTEALNVSITDPKANKIKQWYNVTNKDYGVIENFMLVDTEPILGDWTIHVDTNRVKGRGIQADTKSFTIQQYVLPKFDVHVVTPPYVLTTDKDLQISVNAKYTYGKPVEGTVIVRADLDYYNKPWRNDPKEVMVETNVTINGDVDITIPLTRIATEADPNTYVPLVNQLAGYHVTFDVTVVESINNLTRQATGSTRFYSLPFDVSFKSNNPSYFKPGLPYTAYATITQADGRPILSTDKDIQLLTYVKYYDHTAHKQRAHTLPEQQFATPHDGTLMFVTDTPANADSLHFEIHYKGLKSTLNINKYGSSKKGTMQISMVSSGAAVGSDVEFNIQSVEPMSNMLYIIVANGRTVEAGDIMSAGESSFNFKFPVSSAMEPYAQLVVYFFRNATVWNADSIYFNINENSAIFKNQVSLGFNATTVEPGNAVNLHIQTDPNSLVNLLAVDQSVLLMKTGNDIEQGDVVSALKTSTAPHSSYYNLHTPTGALTNTRGFQILSNVYSFGTSHMKRQFDCPPTPAPGYTYKPGMFPTYVPGMVPTPAPGMTFAANKVSTPAPGMTYAPGVFPSAAPGQTITHVRAFFPETFIWTNITSEMSSSGQQVKDRSSPPTSAPLPGGTPPPFFPGVFPTALPGLVSGETPTAQPGLMYTTVPMPPMFWQTTTKPGQMPLQTVTHVRSFFPETFIWTNITSDVDGNATYSVQVPDTITTWVAGAFAISKQTGLGIAAVPAEFKTFRPFFVSLNLPYSVVRGEEVVLQANVFNYLQQDLQVFVTMDQSDKFKVILPKDSMGNMKYVYEKVTRNITVQAGKAKAVFIPILPTFIGKLDISVKAQSVLSADAVRRQLLVKPEGVEMEYNYATTLSAGENITVPIATPPTFVQDSQIVQVSVIGDIMGPSIQNMNNLLRMPSGCGEQTMSSMAPDIFITKYLETSGQLNGNIRSTALSYMERGYQRELTFQRNDGSFSIWGNSDHSGSMWLTAFVVKSFHQAKPYIYVSDRILSRALSWMSRYIRSSGEVTVIGHVHDSMLQGGASNQYSLSAFTLLALIENEDVIRENGHLYSLLQNTARIRAYLETNLHGMTSPYDLAITSYALARAGSRQAAVAYARLDKVKNVKDGLKYWPMTPTTPPLVSAYRWYTYYEDTTPVDIEIAAYGLLYLIESKSLAEGLPVLKWLLSKRNNNGGFSSTQDTVMALQAISEYQNNFKGGLNLDILVAAGNFTHTVNVQEKDAMVLKTTTVPKSSLTSPVSSTSSPTEVSLEAHGQGSVLAQVSVSLHVENEVLKPSFNVTTYVELETARSLRVRTCVSTLSFSDITGMSVVEIGLPTGFTAEMETSTTPDSKKTEVKDGKLIVYYDMIISKETCSVINMVRTELVAKTQPVAVKVYDYYQPERRALTFYEPTLLKSLSFCDICGECGC